jgi:hypothetical protein
MGWEGMESQKEEREISIRSNMMRERVCTAVVLNLKMQCSSHRPPSHFHRALRGR